MAENAKNNKEHYHQVRDEFDSLKIEEKAAFLVESTFSMLVHGIEAVGKVFSEQINKVYEEEGTAEEKAEEKPKSTPKPRKTTRKRTTSSRSKKTGPKEEE